MTKEAIKQFLKPNKKKAIIFFILCFVFLAIVYSLPSFAPTSSRDARRDAHIRQISVACELYYTDANNDKYPVYKDFADLKAGGIGTYMEPTKLFRLWNNKSVEVPDDPLGGDVHYVWIDNTGEGQDQHFCVYAKLESSRIVEGSRIDTWVVASEKGLSDHATREPTGLGDACW